MVGSATLAMAESITASVTPRPMATIAQYRWGNGKPSAGVIAGPLRRRAAPRNAVATTNFDAKLQPMIACYTDTLSVFPGERFTLHASADKGPCRLEIARVGAGRDTVVVMDAIEIGHHPTPADADRDGCGWPAALTMEAEDWKSGYY